MNMPHSIARAFPNGKVRLRRPLSEPLLIRSNRGRKVRLDGAPPPVIFQSLLSNQKMICCIMNYRTVEVEIDHTNIMPTYPARLSQSGMGLLAILSRSPANRNSRPPRCRIAPHLLQTRPQKPLARRTSCKSRSLNETITYESSTNY